MPEILGLTGCDAGAHAMRQINPDVVAAYPITPQTALVQKFADFEADGLVNSELVLVESEHSAMSATIGAAAAGARAMTATAACGLALMHEMLYIASGLRLPIVMPVVNRALSAPINIQGDHSDTMGCRDAGWIHLHSENAQEVYENTIQAMRIAEHDDVLTPVMICFDGFIISHGVEVVKLFDDEDVQKFVGQYTAKIPTLLDPQKPITIGAMTFSDTYFEHKVSQMQGLLHAPEIIRAVGREFVEKFGESIACCYDFFEAYRLDDADIAIVVLGSTAGAVRFMVDIYREKGIKVGMLKLRVFRPFPETEIREALEGKKAVAVLDRSIAFGADGGPVNIEVKSALYGVKNPPVMLSYIYGLGGKPIDLEHIETVIGDLDEAARTGKCKRRVGFLNLREGDNFISEKRCP
ncbi:pyruvate ferredoxin oxidoreductase [bacterium]|nr:pyruvate ferredoxin oxidoreductase [FCB group bacterium]MBL7191815.1 pyruvate ferredoxin oxidoreductase [bacterium]